MEITKNAPKSFTALVAVTVIIMLVVICIGYCFGRLSSAEADRQDRSTAKWFVLGFFFWFSAFIALKVSKSAFYKGHYRGLWTILGFIFGVFSIIALETGINAEKKCHDFDCWAILGFVFGLFALLISCFLKPYEIQK